MVEGKSQGDIPSTVSTDFQAQADAPGISSDVWLPVSGLRGGAAASQRQLGSLAPPT